MTPEPALGRKLRVVPDPVLHQKCREVDVCDADDLRSASLLAREMSSLMRKHGGAGLAAPQAGELLRLVVLDAGAVVGAKGVRVMVNPSVVEASGGATAVERCLSLPGKAFRVERPVRLRVEGFDLQGRKWARTFSGEAARCVAHELDHLDGVTVDSKGEPLA